MVIRFDLSQIPTDATIQTAKLELYCVRINDEKTSSTDWGVYPLNVSWDDAAVTWTKATATTNWGAGGALGTKYATVTTPYGKNVWKTFDVRPAVAAFVANPTSNKGICIVQEQSSASAGQFLSSDNSDAVHRPKLTITYSGGTSVGPRSALNGAGSRGIRWACVGNMLSVSGGAVGTTVRVLSLDGRDVVSGVVESDGTVSMAKPARGVYRLVNSSQVSALTIQ